MSANRKISRLFSEIASMLEIQDENPFKIRVYKNASELTADLENNIETADLSAVRGIGRETLAKINEFIETGEIEYHKKLRAEVGEGALEFLKLRGVGAKMARVFLSAGIKSVADLERKIQSGELTEIEGVGKKKAEKIAEALAFYKSSFSVHGIGRALSAARVLRDKIAELKEVSDVRIVGAVRRMRETVSEIELLVSLKSFAKAALFFNNFSKLSEVESPQLQADSKSIACEFCGIKTVVHTTGPRDFYFNLTRLTGSPEHFEKLISITKIFYESSTKDRPSDNFFNKNFNKKLRSEEDFYSALNLDFIAPELRENRGEIEAAAQGALPKLVETADIKGDLHTHTNWSDGKNSVAEMTDAARKMGYEYIALTDHSPSSTVANGLSTERLAAKAEEVKKTASQISGITVLMGAEVDIKSDGALDYPDEILAELDFVIASIHSSFSLETAAMTARVVRALENPFVHALGHPTARRIGKRPPCRMDMEKVTDAALKNGKCLEINSSPERLDLNDEHVRMAVEKGVKLIISTDAHSAAQLGMMSFGAAVARRGWARPDDFLNTLPLADLLGRLEKN